MLTSEPLGKLSGKQRFYFALRAVETSVRIAEDH